MQTTSTCCPSLACVVPAVTHFVAPAFTGVQPMQVFMVAPGPAQMMMPMSERNGIYKLDTNGYVAPGAQQFSWSAAGQVPYVGDYARDYFHYENAPQQLPMESGMFTEEAIAQDVRFEPEVPCMDMMPVPQTLAHLQQQPSAKTSSSTLRRRRPQESSAEAWWKQTECYANMEGACTTLEAESDVDLAQELADGLMTKLQAGGTDRQEALASFESLAFSNETTSRAAQLALKTASSRDAVALAMGLRGHVHNAVQSKHANFVLQTITEVMPVAHARFIVDELKGSANKIARRQFGCRVLCRILEHVAPNDHSSLQLLDELVEDDMQELCRHEFGSFVARHILEFGLPHHKQAVINALSTDLLTLSKDKFGSHVVEAALRQCSNEDQYDLGRQLLRNQEDLVAVAGNQFGRHVVRALLSTPGDLKKEAVKVLLPMEGKLRSSRYGKSVVQTLRAAAKS